MTDFCCGERERERERARERERERESFYTCTPRTEGEGGRDVHNFSAIHMSEF